jgi:hypothetical protein
MWKEKTNTMEKRRRNIDLNKNKKAKKTMGGSNKEERKGEKSYKWIGGFSM